MKTSTVVLISFFVSLGVALLIGLGYFIAKCDESQPTGLFSAQDLQEVADYNKKIGAENLRQALIKANRDTNFKSCQDAPKKDTITITTWGFQEPQGTFPSNKVVVWECQGIKKILRK